MASVFISYSRQSVEIVRILAKDIDAIGHDVWMDHELSEGQVWWDQILSQIRVCDIFVFALTQDALNSVACMREAEYASNLNKPILPILISDQVSIGALPAQLSQIQFVDYRLQDRTSVLGLARAFISVQETGPLPDVLPEPPEIPLTYVATLASRVNADELSLDEQNSLVIDLKQGLRDPDTADDTLELIERLAQRDDLYAKIADELGETLKLKKDENSASPIEDPTEDVSVDKLIEHEENLDTSPKERHQSDDPIVNLFVRMAMYFISKGIFKSITFAVSVFLLLVLHMFGLAIVVSFYLLCRRNALVEKIAARYIAVCFFVLFFLSLSLDYGAHVLSFLVSPFLAFLLGIPDKPIIASVINIAVAVFYFWAYIRLEKSK